LLYCQGFTDFLLIIEHWKGAVERNVIISTWHQVLYITAGLIELARRQGSAWQVLHAMQIVILIVYACSVYVTASGNMHYSICVDQQIEFSAI